MTILLTTPLDYKPGHGHPGETLAEIKVIDFHVNIAESWLRMTVQYGNTVNGAWIAGDAPTESVEVRNTPAIGEAPADPAYNVLVGTTVTSAAGVLLYGEVAGNLYQHLLDDPKYPDYAGVIQ